MVNMQNFPEKFEKLYLSRTPKQILPDLLRNNFLDKPALSLIKKVEDIDELWRRLKKAHGDSILLSEKLVDVINLEPLQRGKNRSKAAEILSKIINVMKD